jgi:ribosomal protein S27AE
MSQQGKIDLYGGEIEEIRKTWHRPKDPDLAAESAEAIARVEGICPRCNGDGVFWDDEEETEFTCYRCGGSGRVSEK